MGHSKVGTKAHRDDYLGGLVRTLTALPREAEWVEFKHNNSDPAEIGNQISALANSARLLGKHRGYLVWGVADGSHELVGTTFDPAAKRIGNEILENWLLHLLEPKLVVTWRSGLVHGMRRCPTGSGASSRPGRSAMMPLLSTGLPRAARVVRRLTRNFRPEFQILDTLTAASIRLASLYESSEAKSEVGSSDQRTSVVASHGQRLPAMACRRHSHDARVRLH